MGSLTALSDFLAAVGAQFPVCGTGKGEQGRGRGREGREGKAKEEGREGGRLRTVKLRLTYFKLCASKPRKIKM